MWGLFDMDYNFTMKRFNGTDFDNLYPIGNLEQQNGVLPISKGGTGVTSVSALIDLVGQTGGAKIQTGTYTGTGTVCRKVILNINSTAGLYLFRSARGFLLFLSAAASRLLLILQVYH